MEEIVYLICFKHASCFQRIHKTMQSILFVLSPQQLNICMHTHARTHSMSKGTKLTTSWKKELSQLPVSQSHICDCTRGPAADAADIFYPPGHIFVGQQVYRNLVLWSFSTFDP